jgi:hypothetical protein
MIWPLKYAILNNFEELSYKEFKLTPIRYEHRIKIIKWRNEQIFHLRQEKKLTLKEQDFYFENIVLNQFHEKSPNQILFSFYQNEEFIAYGGFVHIDWINRKAELSFVMDTRLEEKNFIFIWNSYIKTLEKFVKMNPIIITIFTYSFNLRPKLYKVLNKNNFKLVKEELYKKNNKLIKVNIHEKTWKKD